MWCLILGVVALLGLAGLGFLQKNVLDGLRTENLHHGGLNREYLLYEPIGAADWPGKSRPLLIVLHGGGGTHRAMVRATRRRFQQLADLHGFYVVYPNAVQGFWDLGEDPVSRSLPRRIDDLGFLAALLERLVGAFAIDPERIFATGISRGGMVSYYLACRLPGRVRAIAAVAMPLPGSLEDDCQAGPPVGLAVLNGTEDPIVPYEGGEIRLFGRNRGPVLSTDATIRLWLQRNRCSGEGQSVKLSDSSDDSTRVRKTEYSDCEGDASVLLYRIEGGGHTWPSGTQYLPRALVGSVSRDIDAASEIWAFFSTFK